MHQYRQPTPDGALGPAGWSLVLALSLSMPAPQSLVLQLTLAAGLALVTDPARELKVLRVTPAGDAAPTTAVTVTFDRPVAGSLDRIVDARAIFAMTPPGGRRGRLARPRHPALPARGAAHAERRLHRHRRRLVHGDGREPAGPALSVHVPRPGTPGARRLAGRAERRLALPPARRPVRPRAGRSGRLGGGEPGPRTSSSTSSAGRRARFGSRVESQRSVTADDRWDFREAGGWDRDRTRRSAPPGGPARAPERRCRTAAPASWSSRRRFDEQGIARLQRWAFSTYGDFRLERAECGWNRTDCPTGPIVLTFSTPVRGADLRTPPHAPARRPLRAERHGRSPEPVGRSTPGSPRAPATRWCSTAA